MALPLALKNVFCQTDQFFMKCSMAIYYVLIFTNKPHLTRAGGTKWQIPVDTVNAIVSIQDTTLGNNSPFGLNTFLYAIWRAKHTPMDEEEAHWIPIWLPSLPCVDLLPIYVIKHHFMHQRRHPKSYHHSRKWCPFSTYDVRS